MMDEASKLETAKQYLRRKYAADLVGLKRLADKIAESTFAAVTITGMSFEGGQSSGQLTFEPAAYLTAIEGIIAELDPHPITPPRNVSRLHYGLNNLSV